MHTIDETMFEKDGHLWVNRSNMPQVDAQHLPALIRFSRSRGIKVENRHVAPKLCRPVQYISPAEMNRPLHGPISALMHKPVLLSRDFTIIDGNHRWAAWMKAGHPVMPAFVFDAHHHETMEMIWKFPFTYRYGDGKFHAHIN